MAMRAIVMQIIDRGAPARSAYSNPRVGISRAEEGVAAEGPGSPRRWGARPARWFLPAPRLCPPGGGSAAREDEAPTAAASFPSAYGSSRGRDRLRRIFAGG